MTSIRAKLLTLAFLVAGSDATANATVLRVADAASFDAALRAAKSNDTILMEPGVYLGALFAIRGAQGLTIAATGPGVVLVGMGRARGITVYQSTGVVLRGLELDDGRYEPFRARGIFVSGSQRITIEDCVVSGAKRDGTRVTVSEDVHIRGGRVTGSGREGVHVYGSRNVALENLLVEHSNRGGIHVFSSSNVTITGSTSTRNRREGLEVILSKGLQLVGNVVSDNDRSGIALRRSGRFTRRSLLAAGNRSFDNGRKDYVLGRHVAARH